MVEVLNATSIPKLISTELLTFVFSVMNGSKRNVTCKRLGQTPLLCEDNKKCCHMTVEKRFPGCPKAAHVIILGDTG